ncbi:hypothetical protein RFH42_01725 [Acinetobacter rudis]|uniref:RipA family octameric membrane protein n=1 Tax=Acinetobacter rudis TaxID=632955 RepID=UPI0028107886|nr:hypothetical protein [Acinetobacter rudis]MDQ8951677.1 hypothetical protein [Acinetobacter rudis]
MRSVDLISEFFFNTKNNKRFLSIETKSNLSQGDYEKEERLKKIYYIAVKTRNFEITQLVQRNNFFMIFQGVLIASIIYSNNTVPFIHTIICFIGIFISFFQMQIAAGAKFWQEYWENEVNEAEERLNDYYTKIKKIQFHKLFNKDVIDVQHTIYSKYFKKNKYRLFIKEKYSSNHFLGTRSFLTYFPFTKIDHRILTKPSVSKIPIRTARLLLISWIFLFFSSTFLGEKAFQFINGHQIFTGFPGKSVTNIDIRNLPQPNRNDGYDDDRNQCGKLVVPFKVGYCK